MQQYILK